MNPRKETTNDFLNALRGLPCARVPFQEPEVSHWHVDAVLGRRLGLDSTRLSPADYAEFTLATGQSALYCNALWKAGRVYRADSSGGLQYVGGFVRTRDDFTRIEPFDIDGACERVGALTGVAAKHGLAVMVSFPSPFRLALYAMGYADFFTRLHDEPDFVMDLIRHFQEPAARHVEALLKYPVDVFFLGGSICAGSGPMLSPQAIRKYWTPSMQEFLQPVRERNLPVVLHMDGDFSGIVALLLEIPVAAIHPFEVTGNLDIHRFKKHYGHRVTSWGNIDLSTVLTCGTPEQVREDVRLHIESLAHGSRYILASSHEISPDVPVENFLALVKAAREFGPVSTGLSSCARAA